MKSFPLKFFRVALAKACITFQRISTRTRKGLPPDNDVLLSVGPSCVIFLGKKLFTSNLWPCVQDKVSGDDNRLTYSRLTQETCTSHNTIKILQAVFTWTMDMKYLDAMERLVYNGILGTQRIPVEREHRHDMM